MMTQATDSSRRGGTEPLLPSSLLCLGNTDLTQLTDNLRGGIERRPAPITEAKGHFASERKKVVRFSLMSDLYIFDYTPPSRTWYTDADYQGFKRDLKRDILSLRKRLHDVSSEHTTASTAVGPHYCPVGIEQVSSTQDMIAADRLKFVSIQSVLVEQSRQRILGYHDPYRIASLYGRVTAESGERAFKRGKFHHLVKFV
jgi:hypothetical protein